MDNKNLPTKTNNTKSSASPYSATRASFDHHADQDDHQLDKVASGQKLVIYAVIVNFIASSQGKLPMLATTLAVVALVMAIMGILRLATGLRLSAAAKTLTVLATFIPLVNIIVLLILSSKATKLLREAGFTVGLLGASR